MAENMNESMPQQDPNYWKSFEELHRDRDFVEAHHHEFLNGVKDEFDPEKDLSGLSRRKFLAMLGASAALAAAGCSDYRDKGEIVPYNRKPEDMVIGQPNYYASTCTGCAHACGILIKTREGRPIKADGNPDHPVNLGKICAIGQAHVLNLYDPSRLREPKTGSATAAWKEVDDAVLNVLKSAGANEIAVVLPQVVSPTFRKVLADFQAAYPTAKLYSFEAVSEEARRKAWEKSYGTPVMPVVDLSKAKVILSLEADFLGNDGNTVENTRLFTQNRNVEDAKNFSRLYAAEGNMSLTGANADYRLRIKPDNQLAFVLGLVNEIVLNQKKGQIALDSNALAVVGKYQLSNVVKQLGLPAKVVKSLVADLVEHAQAAYVYGGKALDESTHLAINILNEVIGAKAIYRKDTVPVEHVPVSTYSAFKELANNIRSGKVAAVIHVDVNPVYSLPADTGYADALKAFQGLKVSLTEFENETSALSKVVLPIHHTFEAWGDAQPRSTVFSTQQPVIAPLYNTRQKEAVLLVWASGKADSYTDTLYLNYLKKNWEASVYPQVKASLAFDRFWLGVLHDGVVVKQPESYTLGAVNQGAFGQLPAAKTASSFGLLITESLTLGDSKYAQNGWLQELPHPVTKNTWDNYAAVSEATSKKLGVKTNDVVEISVNGKKLHLPVLMQPGLADDFIAVETGYGRTSAPVVAMNVGQNVNTVLTSGNSLYYYDQVTVTRTGEVYKLASTQDHHTYDEALIQDLHKKREIIREGTVAEYIKDKDFIKNETKPLGENMYTDFVYKDVKWALAIDLNKCTGCSDCVVACNVENNIPVVGKDQVLVSREMHWLRIDRYYSGKPESAQVSVQPMLCQHCDQAPCENVCPVAATNHSPDGLNQMVYNRCVGTRYCSNNCPYKVRRFNFFNFRDHFADAHYLQTPMQLSANPEVTVRSRGVMEKCTFCVHRIAEGRAEATREGKTFDGKGITTACQDACAANAIVFGNANDPSSDVAKWRKHNLGYQVLGDLNIRPNVTYLAKLRNIEEEEA